ncbi:PIN2/TERF1-interacting telomerase inhibitor 1-like isoform X2 [Haliotis cracherodii]|uniref:PIN2/TERF1-interacting telomerase inhibitor 1-like isoform X2 n=1 Tax=Haliotis cracherodii TaxID=6455 RepID=UPI0039E959F0
MAMLAEPRRKQKISINPQGTNWSNDGSKFGQKMLERMGWSKGKGLGANEDGRVENVKVSFKNDQKGVGATKNQADNWIAHQDDFNSLLETLNEGHGGGEVDSPTTHQVASLEKKSQSSRSRVHYGKFTKGKDLSSRSHEDLKCIFGKRAAKPTSGKDSPALESAESSGSEDSKADTSHGFNTINSTSTMQEYFAKKMAALKGQRSSPSREDNSVLVSDNIEQPSDNIEQPSDNIEQPSESAADTHSRKKNKKKSKRKNKDIEETVKNNRDMHIEPDNIGSCDVEPQKKKSKKCKRKHAETADLAGDEERVVDNTDGGVEEQTQKKEAKKRKREDEENEKEVKEQVTQKSKKKKKKKKKKSAASVESSELGGHRRKNGSKLSNRRPGLRPQKLPHLVQSACASFRGANVASIDGYNKSSHSVSELLKRIESKHNLVLWQMKAKKQDKQL